MLDHASIPHISAGCRPNRTASSSAFMIVMPPAFFQRLTETVSHPTVGRARDRTWHRHNMSRCPPLRVPL